MRILIADDHAVFRSGLRALLENEEDFEVVAETGTAPETLDAAAKLKPDAILLDVSMPGAVGASTAKAILEKEPGAAIVVLTMHEDSYYLQEFLKAGARGYVLKKSSSTEVVQAIRAAVRGDNYVDPALASHLINPYVGRAVSAKNDGITLTQREREVCRLLALGHTNAEVAGMLFISDRTVETHRNNITNKLGLKNRAQLVRYAIEHGMMKLDQG